MPSIQTTLQPLSMGELFDRAIRLYRRNFFKFIGIVAVMQIPLAGIEVIANLDAYERSYLLFPSPADMTEGIGPESMIGPDYFSGVLVNLLLTAAYLVLISGLASAALTRLAANDYLNQPESSETAFEAYQHIGDRWGPLLNTIFLFIIFSVSLLFWTFIPCIGWLSGPGALLVMSGMVLPLIAPVVVLEKQSGGRAIRRAWDLVRNRFWWVLGFMVLLYLFNWVVVGGPSLLAGFAVNLAMPEPLTDSSAQSIYNLQVIIQSLISMIFNVMYLPLQLTCLTLLYFDLRVRQEGLDLALSATSGNGPQQNILERIAASTPAIREKLVTGREVSFIAGITVAVLALYLAITIGITAVILAAGGM